MAKTNNTAVQPERIFEVRRSQDGDTWHWHAKAPINGKITFQGEGHTTEASALRAINQEMHALGSTKTMHIHVFDKHEAVVPKKTLAREVTAPTRQR